MIDRYIVPDIIREKEAGKRIVAVNNVFIQCTTDIGTKIVVSLENPSDVSIARSMDYIEILDRVQIDAKCTGVRIITLQDALEILDISEEELVGLINAE